jgi:transcriptional regulator with XRE-family HTH domain
MFNQIIFGEKLKSLRKERNFTQEEAGEKIGVSGQAVSKWEKGECLPDVYNLKLLARLYRISIDSLLDIDDKGTEKVIETVKIGGAVFEIIEKPSTILAGKIVYENESTDIEKVLENFDENQRQLAFNAVADPILPICDIYLSINFWIHGSQRGMGFMRETSTENQPEGLDVYKMPASLYIRAYTDKDTAQLMTKQKCEIWELFAYIRNYFMPTHGFKMAENGAQEMEVFDNTEHKAGYAYMPVLRV